MGAVSCACCSEVESDSGQEGYQQMHELWICDGDVTRALRHYQRVNLGPPRRVIT